jgi:hypothetical protein
MTRRTLALAFVMDPIESIQIATDTTFVLMLEALRREPPRLLRRAR